MKKTLVVLSLVFILVAALTVSVFALTPNDDGVYEIGSADDLIAFQQLVAGTPDRYQAKLTADIDMTDKEWTPFGSVAMIFDGQGHTIKGLSRTYEGGGNVGLFVDTVRHDNMEFFSMISNIVFEDCSMNVTVPNAANIGLFGGSDRGSVKDIVVKNFDLTVNQTGNGELHVGGLMGRANHQDINGIYSYVSGTLNADCSITVTSSNTNQSLVRVGGLVGACYNTCVIVENSEVSATITAPNDPAAYIKQLWGNAEVRRSKNNTTLPDSGNASKLSYPTYVATAQEYIDVVTQMNETDKGTTKIFISDDIDFKDVTFVPITTNFTAGFDGQGHTFSNITLAYNNVASGSFGIIANQGQGGSIMNLTIKDSSITLTTPEIGSDSGINLGGVVGYVDRLHFDNLHLENVDITLKGMVAGVANVGGICGYTQYNGPQGAISAFNCSLDAASSVTVDVTDALTTNVGGIFGQFFGNATYGANLLIKDCTNHAPVTGYDLAAGMVAMGGNTSGDNKIIGCKNYGTITSLGATASIICTPGGDNTCLVSDCVAGGFVIGDDSSVDQVFVSGNVTVQNTKVVTIVNPITAEDDIDLSAYFQKQAAGEGKQNVRILFLADIAYLNRVNEIRIKVTFTKGNDVVKTYDEKLGKEVYKSITAGDDVYYSPENVVIFGNIFTDIPLAEADSFTLTVTDSNGDTVCTGAGTIYE